MWLSMQAIVMFNLLLAVVVDSTANSEGDKLALEQAEEHLEDMPAEGELRKFDAQLWREDCIEMALQVQRLGYESSYCEGRRQWLSNGGSGIKRIDPMDKEEGDGEHALDIRPAEPIVRDSAGVEEGGSSTETAHEEGGESEANPEHAVELKNTRSCVIYPNPFLARIMSHWTFEVTSFLVVLLSCVILSLESPSLDKQSTLADCIVAIDLGISIFFAVETTLKMLGVGAKNYLTDPWNRLDFFIVVMAFFSMAASSVDTSGAKAARGVRAVRALRALRALRVVTRIHGLRVVVETIFKVTYHIWTSLLLAVFVLLFFAILGTHLFAGTFWHCSDGTSKSEVQCVGSSTDRWGTVTYRTWINADANFDNMGDSIFSLFQVATMDSGWITILYNGVDAVDQGEAPKENNNLFNALFFVTFLFVGSFVCLALMTGQIVNLYAQLNKKDSMMSMAQKELVQKQRQARKEAAERGEEEETLVKAAEDVEVTDWRRHFYALVTHKYFERFVIAVILCNALTMMIRSATQTQTQTDIVEILNIIYTGIYFFEALFKIIGFGPKVYFLDPWNQFDFLILIFGLIGLAFRGSVSAAVAFRVLRFMRLFKVITTMKGLRQLLTTLALSVPALANVAALLGLLIFIWSVIGMAMFGEKDQPSFPNIGAALYTMLKVLTGDGWSPVLKEISGDTKGIEFGLGLVFLVSFIMFSTYIVLNIFVAIVLVNFTDEVLGQSLADFANGEAWKLKERIVLRVLTRYQAKWRENRDRKVRLARSGKIPEWAPRCSTPEQYVAALGIPEQQMAGSVDFWMYKYKAQASENPAAELKPPLIAAEDMSWRMKQLVEEAPYDTSGLLEIISQEAHQDQDPDKELDESSMQHTPLAQDAVSSALRMLELRRKSTNVLPRSSTGAAQGDVVEALHAASFLDSTEEGKDALLLLEEDNDAEEPEGTHSESKAAREDDEEETDCPSPSKYVPNEDAMQYQGRVPQQQQAARGEHNGTGEENNQGRTGDAVHDTGKATHEASEGMQKPGGVQQSADEEQDTQVDNWLPPLPDSLKVAPNQPNPERTSQLLNEIEKEKSMHRMSAVEKFQSSREASALSTAEVGKDDITQEKAADDAVEKGADAAAMQEALDDAVVQEAADSLEEVQQAMNSLQDISSSVQIVDEELDAVRRASDAQLAEVAQDSTDAADGPVRERSEDSNAADNKTAATGTGDEDLDEELRNIDIDSSAFIDKDAADNPPVPAATQSRRLDNKRPSTVGQPPLPKGFLDEENAAAGAGGDASDDANMKKQAFVDKDAVDNASAPAATESRRLDNKRPSTVGPLKPAKVITLEERMAAAAAGVALDDDDTTQEENDFVNKDSPDS